MNPKKETLETWNKMAEVYKDKFMDMPIYNHTYDFVLENLKNKNAAILDVGCGPGNISKYLINKNSALQILGIDAADEMVKMAQKLVPQCKFEVKDATQLKTIDKKFDAIFVGFCIPYLTQSQTLDLINDCFEMLNEDVSQSGRQGILYLSFVNGNPSQSEWKENNVGDRIYFHYHLTSDIKSNLIKTGFQILQEFEIDYENGDKHQVVVAQKN